MRTVFLDQSGIVGAIKSLLETSDVAKVAVAFWGAGAVERIGIGQSGKNLKIICNLDSGACNPSEMRKLLAVDGAVVRSHPRLHGKVYWTPKGAVIGSSNASSNGLAVEVTSTAGWIEANVLTDESHLLVSAEHWFDMMFEGDEAYEIGDQQLAQAQILWDQRRAIAPSGARLNFDLFEVVRNHAGHGAWSSVKVVITTRPLSSEAQEQHNVLKLDAGFAGLEPYEGMSDLLNPSDWLIDFDFSGRRATSMGVWEAPNAAVVQGDLFYVRRKIGDAIEVSSFGRLLLSAEDQAAIITHAKDIMMHFGSQERGVFCESIEVVVGYFDKLKREAEEASGYKFGPFAAALKRAGVKTNSGRGFWGGRAEDGVPVLTSWLGTREADGTYPVWKPQKNYGGLKSLWESGSIAVGTEVRLILLKPGKGNGDQATVAGAALSEVPWRIASIGDGVTYEARVIPTQSR